MRVPRISGLLLLAIGCGSTPMPPTSVEPATAGARGVPEPVVETLDEASEPLSAVATADAVPDAPPPPARACVAWESGDFESVVRVGPSLIALTHTVDPLGPHGYDGMDQLHLFELRELPTLTPRARRILDGIPYALAVSDDASVVAVATSTSTSLVDATDGAVRAVIPGPGYAVAFGAQRELAISRGETVDVYDSATAAHIRRATITGDAPTVIHAMMADGECQEIFDTTGARATTLAFVDDLLFAGVSDGSVRLLAADDSVRFVRPNAHPGRGYATEAIAILSAHHGSARTLWQDGAELELDTRTLRVSRERAAACSATELRALARSDVEVSAESCPQLASVVTDGERTLYLGGPARVRGPGGASLLAVPNLARVGLLVADEAWVFANDGTGHRWSLDRSQRFLGGVPIEGRGGHVVEVSANGRFVVTSMAAPTPYGNEWPVVSLHVWDTREERELPRLGGLGHGARFIDDDRRVALELHEGQARAVEVREVDTGDVVRRVALGPLEYGGLVAADATRLVLGEDARVRVVSIADGTERSFTLPPCAVERAELRGDRLALLVYDRVTDDISDHRVEVLDLSGETITTIARAEGAMDGGIAIMPDGEGVAFVAQGAVATVLELETGARSPLPGVTDRTSLVARVGSEWMQLREALGGRRLATGGSIVGPSVLGVTRLSDRAHASIVYELGGAAYVVGHDGATRASLHAIDEGLVIESPSGTFSVMGDARRAIAVREAGVLTPCDARFEDLHRAGMLEAVIGASQGE